MVVLCVLFRGRTIYYTSVYFNKDKLSVRTPSAHPIISTALQQHITTFFRPGALESAHCRKYHVHALVLIVMHAIIYAFSLCVFVCNGKAGRSVGFGEAE